MSNRKTSKQDAGVAKAKEALQSLTPNQSLLVSNTIGNLSEGSYWSIFTQKEFEKTFEVSFNDQDAMQEVQAELGAIAKVEAISTASGEWNILATYNNVEDFFTLFAMINPNAMDKINEVKTNIYKTMNENVDRAKGELTKLVERALKKDGVVNLAIYSLNKSGTAKVVNADGSEKNVKAFSVSLDSLMTILSQVIPAYGVSYRLVNPLTGAEHGGTGDFVMSNSSETGGIYTLLQLF